MDPDPDCSERLDPDLVSPERLDPDPDINFSNQLFYDFLKQGLIGLKHLYFHSEDLDIFACYFFMVVPSTLASTLACNSVTLSGRLSQKMPTV